MQLTWPDDLKPEVERQAQRAGCASIDEFTLRMYLHFASPPVADWEEIVADAGLPSHHLEAEIQAGIDSGPATPMTDDDWIELRRRVSDRPRGSAS
jgi:hypothetical protein